MFLRLATPTHGNFQPHETCCNSIAHSHLMNDELYSSIPFLKGFSFGIKCIVYVICNHTNTLWNNIISKPVHIKQKAKFLYLG